MLDNELLGLIACPSCIGSLHYEPDRSRLVCPTCRVAYPIEDEIPALLKEAAVPLEAGWSPRPNPGVA